LIPVYGLTQLKIPATQKSITIFVNNFSGRKRHIDIYVQYSGIFDESDMYSLQSFGGIKIS
jgi:hypothetical protein